MAENVAVFHGWDAAGIDGIATPSPTRADPARRGLSSATRATWPRPSSALRAAGVPGPYGLALGPDAYTARDRDHRARRLSALRAPAPDPRRPDRLGARGRRAGSSLSLRGGDFLFECGQDLSIGYESHDADAVHLYLEESFSFRVATPEAAVALPG